MSVGIIEPATDQPKPTKPSAAKSWLHLDVYAWTPSAKSARPEGGECQAARALYALLCKRYD